MLTFDRNLIMAIPNELTECVKLIQISFEECSRLITLPKNILTMPNLVNVSFKKCSFFTLPSIISSKIENLLLVGNQLLNCVPHGFAKFIEPNIDTSEFYMVNDEKLGFLLEAQ